MTSLIRRAAVIAAVATCLALAAVHIDAQRTGARLQADRPAQRVPNLTPAFTWAPWSAWARADGVEYRSRAGLNPAQPRYATQVDAVFEMRNRQPRVWVGAARAIDCAAETLVMSRNVTLQPNERKTVTFLTPNCGTKANPAFRPNVVRSVRID